MSQARVTLCVPVYNAAAFIEETLQSIRSQTCPDIQVLLSVDRSEDNSAAICGDFDLGIRRQFYVQDQRLDYVGNINFLLEKVTTPYFCIVPHDDLLEPEYIETLVAYLESTPSAVVAYTEIDCFGLSVRRITEPSILGTRLQRIVTYLDGRDTAVAFRGVVRTEQLPATMSMPQNRRQGFASDSAWMLYLACHGELHRVETPRMLYHKRMQRDSVVHQWLGKPLQWHLDAWFEHCVNCADIALRPRHSSEGALHVVRALVDRLTMANGDRWSPSGIHFWTEAQKNKLIEDYFDRIADRLAFQGINLV